jgi:hypothetical protein
MAGEIALQQQVFFTWKAIVRVRIRFREPVEPPKFLKHNAGIFVVLNTSKHFEGVEATDGNTLTNQLQLALKSKI